MQHLAKRWNVNLLKLCTHRLITLPTWSWSAIQSLLVGFQISFEHLPKFDYSLNSEGKLTVNIFSSVNHVSSTFLLTIVRGSLRAFLNLLKISPSIKFLVTSVSNGLRFKLCFIIGWTVDLDIPGVCNISQGVRWKLGSFSWLSISSFKAKIVFLLFPILDNHFPYYDRLDHEPIFCLEYI